MVHLLSDLLCDPLSTSPADTHTHTQCRQRLEEVLSALSRGGGSTRVCPTTAEVCVGVCLLFDAWWHACICQSLHSVTSSNECVGPSIWSSHSASADVHEAQQNPGSSFPQAINPSLPLLQSMLVNTHVELRYRSSLNQNGADNLEDVCAAATARSKMLMESGFEQLGYAVAAVRARAMVEACPA